MQSTRIRNDDDILTPMLSDDEMYSLDWEIVSDSGKGNFQSARQRNGRRSAVDQTNDLV